MKKAYWLILWLLLLGGLYFFSSIFSTRDGSITSDTQLPSTQSVNVVSAPLAWTYDLALTKKPSDPSIATYLPWDEVDFTITLINQWSVPSGAVQVIDYAVNGLTFVSSTLPSSISEGNVVVAYEGVWVWWSKDAILTYKIDEDFPWGPLSIYAEIFSDSGDDVDSDPDADNTNDCLEDDVTNKSCN